MELVSSTTNAIIIKEISDLNENRNFERLLCQLSGFSELPVSKIIVADDDYNSYNDTVNQYSREKDVVTNTPDLVGCAKTIFCITEDRPQIYIVMKQFIFWGLLKYLQYRCSIIDKVDDTTQELANIFFHELGHAFDHMYLYLRYGYLDQEKYSCNMRTDAEKYYTVQAIALFSEYFAQIFADSIVPSKQRFDDETVIAHINSLEHTKNVIDHAQETAYMFAFLAAHYFNDNDELNLQRFGLKDGLTQAISDFCIMLKERFRGILGDSLDFACSNSNLALSYENIVKAEDEGRNNV